MLTIRDLSKEIDMTAVRGGNDRGWQSCGDEDSRDRDDRHDGDRDDRHRQRCGDNDGSKLGFAPVGINLSAYAGAATN